MSAHTPGPWIAEAAPLVKGGRGYWQIVTSEGLLLVADLGDGETGQEAANAVLMAEAPALLEALRALTPSALLQMPDNGAAVRAAIAKAEGRAAQ